MPIRHEPVALMLSRQPLPTLDRQRYTSAAGLARGAYVLADPTLRRARGDPDRHRQRAGNDGGRLRATHRRRDPGPGGVHAVDGAVRQTAARLPRRGAAAVGDRAGGGGEGLHVRLGPLGRSHRGDHRDEHVRRVGAAQGAAGQVRFHRRPHRRGRTQPARPRPRHRHARRHPRNRRSPSEGTERVRTRSRIATWGCTEPAALAAGGWARRVIKRAATGLRSTRCAR